MASFLEFLIMIIIIKTCINVLFTIKQIKIPNIKNETLIYPINNELLIYPLIIKENYSFTPLHN